MTRPLHITTLLDLAGKSTLSDGPGSGGNKIGREGARARAWLSRRHDVPRAASGAREGRKEPREDAGRFRRAAGGVSEPPPSLVAGGHSLVPTHTPFPVSWGPARPAPGSHPPPAKGQRRDPPAARRRRYGRRPPAPAGRRRAGRGPRD